RRRRATKIFYRWSIGPNGTEASMCGIVGFLDKNARRDAPTGALVLAMLDALGCRGPDSAGIALLREPSPEGALNLRLAPVEGATAVISRLGPLARVCEAVRD